MILEFEKCEGCGGNHHFYEKNYPSGKALTYHCKNCDQQLVRKITNNIVGDGGVYIANCHNSSVNINSSNNKGTIVISGVRGSDIKVNKQ